MSCVEHDFKNWLYQIARWKVSDFRKKEKAVKRVSKDKTTSPDNIQEAQISLDNGDEADHFEAAERMEALKTLLDKLSFDERHLLVLRYFEERTYGEIAQILRGQKLSDEESSKMAAVLRKQVSRLHDKLRKIIKGEPLFKELVEI